MADAAYVILTKDSKDFTGNFYIDDNLLADNGVKDFSKYASTFRSASAILYQMIFLLLKQR